jgi:hypothetical protein
MFRSFTSNSDPQKDRIAVFQFLRHVLVWFSPCLIALLLVEVALWRAGESMPLSRVEKLLRENSPGRLFMRQYFDQGLYRLKHLMVEKRHPRVLILGTSRVMQFRQEMFRPQEGEFCNAGGMIQHLRDLEEFTATLSRTSMPEVVILGVEMWWFNPIWHQREESRKFYNDASTRDGAYDAFAHASVLRSFIRQCISPGKSELGHDVKTFLSPLVQGGARSDIRRIGYYARTKQSGFRGDGSFDYGLPVPSKNGSWDFVDREKPTIEERIRMGMGGFELTSNLSDKSLRRFRSSLRRMRELGATIICFTPPFASSVVTLLENDPRHSAFWQKYLLEISTIAKEEGASMFIIKTPTDLGLDDRAMIDGIHAMETFHVALLRQISMNNELNLFIKLDQARLSQMLADESSNQWFPVYN